MGRVLTHLNISQLQSPKGASRHMDYSKVDQAIASTFKEIKPYCVDLSKIAFSEHGSFTSLELVESLRALDAGLKTQIANFNETLRNEYISADLPSSLADYIFVPVAQLLKRTSVKDAELEHIFSIINLLIRSFWSCNGSLPTPLASQLLQLITFLIGGPPNSRGKETSKDQQNLKNSEETIFNGLKCLNSLYFALENQGETVLNTFLNDTSNLPALGHMVSVLLEITLRLHSNVEAQLLALETLDNLYKGFHDGEILSFMLPGNVSTIAKLFSNRNGQRVNYNVVAKGFEVLSTLFSFVFNDDDLKVIPRKRYDLEEVSNLEDLASKVSDGNSDKELLENDYDGDITVEIPVDANRSEKIHRDSSWLRATSFQIKKAFKYIVNVDLSKSKVRDTLSLFLEKIVQYNYQTLHLLLPMVIETLSKIFNVDKVDRISGFVYVTSHQEDFQELLSSSLNTWIDKIPVVFSMSTGEKILDLINNISSMLQVVFGSTGGSSEFIIEKLIRRLRNELVALLQKSNKETKIIVSNTISGESIEKDMLLVSNNYSNNQFEEIEGESDSRIFDKIFDKDVEESILSLLSMLGDKSVTNSILTEMMSDEVFIDNSNANNLIEKSVLIWMSSVISKSGHASIANGNSNVIKLEGNDDNDDAMDEYLQFSDDEDDDDDCLAHKPSDDDLQIEIQNNVYTYLNSASEIMDVCLSRQQDSEAIIKSSVIALRSIAYASQVLGADFKQELIDYVYPVVDSLASTNSLIRLEAQKCALDIANNCYDGSVHDLIFENCDYLIDSLSIRLTGDSITPRTPMVLLVLIQIGGLDILTQLGDIITTMFTLLDLYHGYSALCEGFFAVFNGVVDSILKEYFANYDFEKLAKENEDENVLSYEPWGMKSMDQVVDLVKGNNRDLDIPEEVTEDFDSRQLKKRIKEVVDSDDEDSDDDDADLFSEAVDSQAGDGRNDENEEEKESWNSPITYDLYLMLQKIMTYGDRLSKHKSIRLQLQIQRISAKIIPILGTSKKHLLPVIASQWPVLSSDLNSDNLHLVIGACSTISEAIKFTGSFLSNRYLQLWEDTIKVNPKIQELIKISKHQNTKKADGVHKALINRTSTSTNLNQVAFIKVIELLILGLERYGRLVPNSRAFEILEICVLYEKNPDRYGYFDDTVLFLTTQEW